MTKYLSLENQGSLPSLPLSLTKVVIDSALALPPYSNGETVKDTRTISQGLSACRDLPYTIIVIPSSK